MKCNNYQENAPLEQEVLADISPEGQHEKRLSRYSSAKMRQESVLDFILTTLDSFGKGNLQKEAEALQGCGSFLIFRHYYTVDVYKMVAGCTCKKHLLCALCAIRRAAKYIAIYSQKIKAVVLDNDQEFDTVMITFTVKNGPDLEERFNHLLVSMKRLLQKRRNALRVNPEVNTLFKHVVSAVYSYEITWNDVSEEWHPHCHMIGLIPKGSFKFDEISIKGKSCFVPWELKNGLVQDWELITGDSKIIDIRRIDRPRSVRSGSVLSDSVRSYPGISDSDPEILSQDLGDNSLLKALVEVFKYALKMNDLDVQQQVHVYETLKGRRLIGSFGALRGIRISENLNDKPLSDSELPFIDLLYQYSGVSFGYQEIIRGKFDLEPSPRSMLDLKNRIDKNRKNGSPGHFSFNIDKRNDIQSVFKFWIDDPLTSEKVASQVRPPGSF